MRHQCKVGPEQRLQFIRTIGILRATARIGMQDLAYNMRRVVVLERCAMATG